MMHTSVPLKLLSSPWLDETSELPVLSTNKVWHQGLMVNEAKKCRWLDRVDGRFKAKARQDQLEALSPSFAPTCQVKVTIAANKLPNLRNFAHTYRDPEKELELVWRMACMFEETMGHLAHAYPDPLEFKAQIMTFNRGGLDGAMMERCRAMDPEFTLSDWRFIRIQAQAGMASWAPDALANHVQEAGTPSSGGEWRAGAVGATGATLLRLSQPARRRTGTSWRRRSRLRGWPSQHGT